MTSVAAIIPAAGSGSRLVADDQTPGIPKALRRIGPDSLIRHAVRSLEHVVDQVVVACPPDLITVFESELVDVPVALTVVEGGTTRQATVRLAAAALAPTTELVLVHDAARPLVPVAVVDRVVAALDAGAQAVVPVVEVSDTLRRLLPLGVSETVDRSTIRAVQTPQGFRADVLRQAHADAGPAEVTDDACLVERLGVEVVLVPGDPLGFKITRALDLAVARAAVVDPGQT